MGKPRPLALALLLSLPLLGQERKPADPGVVTTDFFGGTDKALATTTDAQGRVLVAGYASEAATEEWDAPPSPDPRRWLAVARYSHGGKLDRSFGSGGSSLVSIRDHAFATALAVDDAGRIVASGYACGAANGSGCDFLAVRLTPEGTLDRSFGDSGIAVVPFPGTIWAYARSVALGPGGAVVLAGNAGSAVALARLDGSGVLDPTFGAGGTVTVDVPQGRTLEALVVLADGGLVAAAQSRWDHAGVLLGFRPDGSADPAFGTGGVLVSPAGVRYTALAPAPRGGILVGGAHDDGGRSDFLVARLDRTGALDPSFGSGGTAVVNVSQSAVPGAPQSGGAVRSLAILRDGGIAAAGTLWTDIERARFGVAFLAASGSAQARRRPGVVEVDPRGTIAEAGGLALLPGGDLVVAGSVQRVAARADQVFDWGLAPVRPAAR